MNNLTKAAQDVLSERARQIKAEGWSPEHDDRHRGGELSMAAAVDLGAHLKSRDAPGPDGTFSDRHGFNGRLHWVIVGGESGHHARPMHPDWARSLRDQCATAGVPYLFKQWGEWIGGDQTGVDVLGTDEARPGAPREYSVRMGKKAAGRLLDGRTHDGFPGVANG